MGSSGSKRLCKVLGVHHLSQIQVLSTSDIDRIWKDYDSDHNELLEGDEVTSFLKDFASALGIKYTKKLALEILQSISENPSATPDLRHSRLDFAAFHRLLISLYAKAEAKALGNSPNIPQLSLSPSPTATSSPSRSSHAGAAAHTRLLLSGSVRASGLEAHRSAVPDFDDPFSESEELSSESYSDSQKPTPHAAAEDIFTLQEAKGIATEYRTPKWTQGHATNPELGRFFSFLRKLLRTVAVFGTMMPKTLRSYSSFGSMAALGGHSHPSIPHASSAHLPSSHLSLASVSAPLANSPSPPAACPSPTPDGSPTSQSFNELNQLVLEMSCIGLIYIYHQTTDEATGIQNTLFPLAELMETIILPSIPVAPSLAAHLYSTIISKPDHHDFFSLSPRFFDILSRATAALSHSHLTSSSSSTAHLSLIHI